MRGLRLTSPSWVIYLLITWSFIAYQSLLDHDSFLPSAVHRYHQLVLPALELANSLIATLGVSSQASKPVRFFYPFSIGSERSDCHCLQALDFLLAHRETFLILLRESTPAPSLQQIRELHLLVSMCSYVTSRVERAELVLLNFLDFPFAY